MFRRMKIGWFLEIILWAATVEEIECSDARMLANYESDGCATRS